jgi:ATP-dependent RNA helicase HelY
MVPYKLDDFQLEAIDALANRHSVLVAAPTGTGKTVVGEFGIFMARKYGMRAIYTTPIKALSNQKYRDFRARWGDEEVGLLTGDVVVNRDAPVLVMTTDMRPRRRQSARTHTSWSSGASAVRSRCT